MILDMVNEKQETLKKFIDNKNREFEKALEEINHTSTVRKVKQRTELIKR
jgi:hypothetical protein